MTIAIDGITVSHPQPGGYRTYATNLVQGLAACDTDYEFVLLLDRPTDLDLPPTWHTKVVTRRMPFVGVALREQVGIPFSVRRSGADLLHSPCATGPLVHVLPSVVTILDTIEFTVPLPSLRYPRDWAMRQYSRFVQEKAAHLASSVITISQYSKQRIVKRFGIAPSKVVVTPLAPAARFSGSDRLQSGRSVDREYGLRDYILVLASASPRKNVDRLLYSYCLLGPAIRSRFSLAITCAHSSLKDRLAQTAAELDIAASTVFLEHVSDEGLVNLMTGAALFVFPSLEEGFGLPPLEAMACGTPVVASNTSSLPEVLGDAALLVPPTDTQAIAEAMAAVLTTPSLAADLSERGLAQSRQFSWETTARQTLAVYESVLQGGA